MQWPGFTEDQDLAIGMHWNKIVMKIATINDVLMTMIVLMTRLILLTAPPSRRK